MSQEPYRKAIPGGRVSDERREALLDEFEKSGLSGQKFAQLAGINYGTFMNWAQKRHDARKQQGRELRATEAVQLLWRQFLTCVRQGGIGAAH